MDDFPIISINYEEWILIGYLDLEYEISHKNIY